jgi:hypothetical protein
LAALRTGEHFVAQYGLDSPIGTIARIALGAGLTRASVGPCETARRERPRQCDGPVRESERVRAKAHFAELEEGQKENHLLLHTTQIRRRLHLVILHLYYNLMRCYQLEAEDEPRKWQRPRTRASNRVIQRGCGRSRDPA